MTRYDNYPDDIRCYDHDPRSPFYDPPTCSHCGEELTDEVCPCQEEDEDDPTPWCSYCGSMTIEGCDCGPIAENH